MTSARTIATRFIGDTGDLEAAMARAGSTAEVEGKRIGDAFNTGTSRAGGALSRLGQAAASWGIPFAGSLEKMGKQLDDATTKSQKFHSALVSAGKVTLAAGTAGLAAAGVEATRLGEKFQTTTASVAANSGISVKAAQRIGQAFLDTAGHSVFSGQKIAAAYAQVAGQLRATVGHALGTAQAMRVMTSAGNLAEASQTDLGTSTQALSNVMQAYHLSVGQASHASDDLFNVSKTLAIPVTQVATALDRLHTRLGTLAPTLSDVSGLMTELGMHGVQGSRGLNVVNTAMSTLVGGSTKVTATLRAVGVHIFDAQGKFIGLRGVIQQLQPKLAGLSQQQQLFAEKTLFGAGAYQIMGRVIQAGVPGFQAATQAATKLGTAHQAATQQEQTLHAQMERLGATVTDLGTKFGLWLIPKVQALGSALASGITWLSKHKAAALALAGVITGVLGVAIGAYIVNKIAGFVDSTKSAMGAIGSLKGWLGQLVAKFTGTGIAAQGMATETEAAAGQASGAVSGATAKIAADSEAIDTSLATISASFEGVGAAAAGATATVGAEMAALAGEVEAADAAIEGANAAAGASFTALLGPLSAVVGGAAGAAALINAIPVNSAPAGWNGRGGRFGVPLPGSGGGSGGNVGTLAAPSGAAANSQLLNVGANSNAAGVGTAVAKAQELLNASHSAHESKTASTKAINAALAALQKGKAVSGSGGSGGGGGTPTQTKVAMSSPGRVTSGRLTRNQQEFAAIVSEQTGLDPRVVTAWLLAEENGGAAAGRQGQNYNDWLNIGWTDSGRAKVSYAPDWGNVQKAAADTANWLKGTWGQQYGYTASSGIQGIVPKSRGQTAATQMSAIANSGWASSGYPLLGQIYSGLGNVSISGAGKNVSGTAKNVNAGSVKFGVPSGVLAGLNLAQQLVGAPYNNGSGHSAAFDETVAAVKKFGTDCSGLVSVILKKIEGNTPGHITSAQTTQGLPTAGGLSTGQGRYVTVWDRHTGPVGDEHTIIDILGKWFESGGNKAISPNPNHVVQLTAQQAAREMAQGAPFQAFHPTQFNSPVANGLTGTVGGTSTSGSGTTPNINQLIQQVIAGLSKSATSLISTWTTAQQNASVKSLESALGVTTSGGTGAHLSAAVKALQPSVGANGPTNAQLNYVLTPLLQEAMAGTAVFHAQLVGTLSKVHGAALSKLDALLGEKHKASLTTLVGELIGLHRGAVANAVSVLGKSHDKHLRSIAGELSAGPQASVSEKNYNALIANLRASHDKALTALIPKLVAAHQQMLLALDQELWAKAESAYARGLSLQATELRDQTSIAATMAANVVQAMKDSAQQMSDWMSSAAGYIKDSATSMSDALQATAKAIEDQTQAMADASSAQVSGIQDQSQTVTDTLAERGLYGLNLVAQQQQVALDQMKTGYDQQLGQAQAAIDTAQANTDNASAAAQAYMDAIQTQQDVLTGAAQQNLDAVAAAQNASVGAAQRNLDNVTKSTDAAVQQAQNAVESASTGTKAQQDAAAAALEQAQATQSMQVAQAQGALSAAQNAANQAVQQAQGALDSASGQAAIAEAQAQAAVANAQGNASVLIAQAKQTLQTVTDQANVAEAQQQAIVAKIQAEAQTQYAGSGLVINIEGINPTDAAAIASEVGWQLRTLIPA